MGSSSNMAGVLIKRQTDRWGRWPCDDGGRDWRDASASQGTEDAHSYQKLEETRKGPPTQVSEGALPTP